PALEAILLAAFFALGRSLTQNHFSKTQHILDPALTLLLAVVTASQFGLLLSGIGSDLDYIRLTGFALGAVLLVLGIVLFEAERHTYAGLRMPWPIASDRAWRRVHRLAGLAAGLAGAILLWLAWQDAGAGALVTSFALALLFVPATASLATLAMRSR
ncbi:MAG: SdpI family protein, partial [Devosia sp.]|nr:SdpI family protein [Devosia sp.]